MVVEVYLVNSYFDSDDYKTPFNTYLDDRFSYNLIPEFTKQAFVFIQKNEVEYQDNYFSYKPGGKKKDIIGVQRFDNRLSVEGSPHNNVFSKSTIHKYLIKIKLFCF
mmetsp:Transcript_7776/g.6874  ORF Transcript_7776/g.6874 Transcript_7776/m.6874 type:complete len:107 (+) Transcript_7776:628-948(+)